MYQQGNLLLDEAVPLHEGLPTVTCQSPACGLVHASTFPCCHQGLDLLNPSAIQVPIPYPLPCCLTPGSNHASLRSNRQLWGNNVHLYPLQPEDVKLSPSQGFALWKWIDVYSSVLHRRGAMGKHISEQAMKSQYCDPEKYISRERS